MRSVVLEFPTIKRQCGFPVGFHLLVSAIPITIMSAIYSCLTIETCKCCINNIFERKFIPLKFLTE